MPSNRNRLVIGAKLVNTFVVEADRIHRLRKGRDPFPRPAPTTTMEVPFRHRPTQTQRGVHIAQAAPLRTTPHRKCSIRRKQIEPLAIRLRLNKKWELTHSYSAKDLRGSIAEFPRAACESQLPILHVVRRLGRHPSPRDVAGFGALALGMQVTLWRAGRERAPTQR